MKKSSIFLLVLATVILTAVSVYLYTSQRIIRTDEGVFVSKEEYDKMNASYKRFSKLLELEDHIKKNYYEDTSKIDFDTAILRGLFQGLGDQYSTYFTADEFRTFNQELEGSFVGIGAHVELTSDNLVRVVAPIKGSPAYEASLLPGDIIYQVDDTVLGSLTLQEAVNLIKGEEGSKVKIYIRRDTQNLEFELTRAKVTVPSVEPEMKSGQTAYIKINEFDRDTAKDFRTALQDLLDKGATTMILDLRNNGGGLLDEAVDIADRLLGKTTVVSVVSGNGKTETFDSDETNRLSIPYVVLINGGSASASEILAGAIKDTKSAVLIGEKSFGKGIVQTSSGLQDGSGFKLTTAYYLTPNGNNIHGKGIEPDINYEQMHKEGYTWEDTYRIGEDSDKILQYALDYLHKK